MVLTQAPDKFLIVELSRFQEKIKRKITRSGLAEDKTGQNQPVDSFC